MIWQKHDNQFQGFVNMQETFVLCVCALTLKSNLQKEHDYGTNTGPFSMTAVANLPVIFSAL
jgi:hypothetical protein